MTNIVKSFALVLLMATLAFCQESKQLAKVDAVKPSTVSERLDALIVKNIRDRKIAGATAWVFHEGQVVYENAIGFQDIANLIPMSVRTRFRLASMTKPITSVGIMMLVERGLLRLDQPLSSLLPHFSSPTVAQGGLAPRPAAGPITIAHLLSHTSGLTYGLFNQTPQVTLINSLGLCEGLTPSKISLQDNMQTLSQIPLVADPGTAWQYGMSTDVLGAVIEKVSGQTLEAFLDKELFQPLKMQQTSFGVQPDEEDFLATLYCPNDSKQIAPVTEEIYRVGNVAVSPHAAFPDNQYRSGGAGLVSTAQDYSRFLRMLLNEGEFEGVRFLKPETIQTMTRNRIGNFPVVFPIHGDGFGYGFGIHSDKSERMGASVGTYSWGGIFHTYFWVDPEQKVIGILLTQLFPFDHMTLWADFQRTTYEALHDKN
jgi:CubicO group peptidase (beta-lactamase class C family)